MIDERVMSDTSPDWVPSQDWIPVMSGYQSDWVPVMTGYPVRLVPSLTGLVHIYYHLFQIFTYRHKFYNKLVEYIIFHSLFCEFAANSKQTIDYRLSTFSCFIELKRLL